jgi:hypothetical protein
LTEDRFLWKNFSILEGEKGRAEQELVNTEHVAASIFVFSAKTLADRRDLYTGVVLVQKLIATAIWSLFSKLFL